MCLKIVITVLGLHVQEGEQLLVLDQFQELGQEGNIRSGR
jgi:hypothetical protein